MSFGCPRNRFDGNPKYLFIEYSRKGYDVCWLSADKKVVKQIRQASLKAEYTFSIKGLLWALSSQWWLVGAYTSDILFCLSGGAKVFNLWHGVGIKLCEFNIKTGPLANRYYKKTLRERFYHPEVFRRPDLMLTASPFQTDMFSPAFRIEPAQCVEQGYPRNLILTCPERERIDFIKKYEASSLIKDIEVIKGFNKVYVYMPTWRDDGSSALRSIDFGAINDILYAKNEALIIKDHFNNHDDRTYREGNIFHYNPATDIYPLLPYTHVLITDYSSILYDYILMEDKSVILYLFDYSSYKGERDFYYPFDDNTIGQKVYTMEQLEKVIHDGPESLDPLKRKALIEKFWGKNPSYHDFSNYLHLQ